MPEWLRAVKFMLISAPAGVIQLGSFNELATFPDWVSTFGEEYGMVCLIALVLSELWNFKIVRRYTFRSAANVPVEMLRCSLFTAFFAGYHGCRRFLHRGLGRNKYLVLIGTMC